MKIYIVFVVFAVAVAIVEACHHGKEATSNANFEIHARKRRSTTTQDADLELSEFFTECMGRKTAPGLIPVWRSVVDFVLRDTIWYRASDTYFCSGTQDNFGCWQGIMDLLTDWDSQLLGPSRECILEYSTGTRTGGYKQKRAIPSETELGQTNQRVCPGASPEQYRDCIELEINETATYPSLQYFEYDSVAIFVRYHFSRCRIEEFHEPWRKGGKSYRRNCGGARFRGANHEKVDTAEDQCVPLMLLDITRELSPVRTAVKQCNWKFADYEYIYEDDDENATVTTLEEFEELDEFQIFGPRGRHNGADIVGYCAPNANFSGWFDSNPVESTGDSEMFSDLKVKYPEAIMCDEPSGIQIRVTRTDEPYYSSGNVLRHMSPQVGLLCENTMQHNGRPCENYKVRFCCFENPKQIPKSRGTIGTCGENDRWSKWMNIDTNPENGGDFEILSESGLRGCDPVAIQGRLAGSGTPYTLGNNNLRDESPRVGIVCSDDMQPKERPCKDYEVRFCCRDGKGARRRRPV